MSRQLSPRSRRGLLLGGAGAAVAAALAATEDRANAASVPSVLLGRTNAGGTRTTALTATARAVAWQVTHRGTGIAAALYAKATAVLGATSGTTTWGVHGRDDATKTGTGGAVRAEGKRNAGLLADTTVQDVPALVAIGGDGTGVAQVATGQSYLDGDALALRAWTGVVAADKAHVVYAPLVSGEAALHTGGGHVTLDSTGGAVVALPDTFLSACDMTTLRVSLTPVGGAMAGLYVTYRQASGAAAGVFDGFTVAGGTAAGTVAWSAWAVRAAVDLAQLHGGSAAGRAASASGAAPSATTPTAPARATRRSVKLPSR